MLRSFGNIIEQLMCIVLLGRQRVHRDVDVGVGLKCGSGLEPASAVVVFIWDQRGHHHRPRNEPTAEEAGVVRVK